MKNIESRIKTQPPEAHQKLTNEYSNGLFATSNTLVIFVKRPLQLLTTLGCCWLMACSSPLPEPAPGRHLGNEFSKPEPGRIPEPVVNSLSFPPPTENRREPLFSVTVNNVPAADLLFVLARDARLNLDIHPGIAGTVTLNAVNQSVPQLLTRIARQVDLRYELNGQNLVVMPDTPFLQHYPVDYVNVARQVSSAISTNTQIPTGIGNAGQNAGTPAGSSNISNTRIENTSRNHFWESLERNLKDLLRETDKLLPDGSSETVVEQSATQSATGAAALPHAGGQKAAQAMATALQNNPNPSSSSQSVGNSVVRRNTFREAASIIVNPEGGIVSVRATQRQHERVQEFLDRIAEASRRQVMIEATIIEVTLNDGYQQGINWRQLAGQGVFEYIGNPLANTVNLAYRRDGNPEALISLLETFGTAKVISSPRISVVNNQTALLKVVENYVYFNVKADITSTANVGSNTVYTTTPQSVSVGLIVSVTPQISSSDMILLNVRPTITSVAREVADPNPELARYGIRNNVPVIRTREIESILRIASGHTAVLGGLMQDQIDQQTQRLPGLGTLPLAGEVFSNRQNSNRKSELVILLRPLVVRAGMQVSSSAFANAGQSQSRENPWQKD